jgi:hypothetical protein
MTFVFAKSVSLVLAITFTLHILLRGLWAAVLGLHSVYPDGVRWENVKAGPIFKRVSQEKTPTLPVLISRLDNTASVVFALGAVLLQVTVIAAIGQFVSLGLVAVIHATTGFEVPLTWLFGMLGILFLGSLTLATTIDKRKGDSLAPESRAARVIERVARFVSVVGMSRTMGPMMLTFTSRAGQTRGTIGILLLLYAVFGIVLVQVLNTLGVWSLDGYRFLSRSGPGVIVPSYYQDQREGNDRYETTPVIPGEVVSDGWLRVFVPYRIDAFDAAAARSCPTAVAQADAADTALARTGRDSVLACVGRLLEVTIDDQQLPSPKWHPATDAGSGLRGLLTYLPITALPDGPHQLSMTRIPRPRAIDASKGKPMAKERYEIPFWIDRSGNR